MEGDRYILLSGVEGRSGRIRRGILCERGEVKKERK
jgi:hypothetical protein